MKKNSLIFAFMLSLLFLVCASYKHFCFACEGIPQSFVSAKLDIHCHGNMQNSQSTQNNDEACFCCFVSPFAKSEAVVVQTGNLFATGKTFVALSHWTVSDFGKRTNANITLKYFHPIFPHLGVNPFAIKQSFLIWNFKQI